MSVTLSQRIEDLVFVTERLISLLENENAALFDHDAVSVQKTLKEKERLCRIYETNMRALSEVNEQIGEADHPLLDRLRNLLPDVERLMNTNAIYLKAAIEANNNVLESFIEAAKENRSDHNGYTAAGSQQKEERSDTQGLALSLNQVL